MRLALRLIATTTLIIVAACLVVVDPDDANYAITVAYLQKYGYLASDVEAFSAQRRNDVLRDAIETFQRYYELPVDGTLNDATVRLIRAPRCGVRDIQPRYDNDDDDDNATAVAVDSQTNPKKWPRTNLTWHFFVASDNDWTIARAAFDMWSRHSALTFEHSAINPDIIISYRTRHHRNANTRMHGEACTSDFDGTGGVLAHAFLPDGRRDFVSEVHVDAEEAWHISLDRAPEGAYSLLLTLIHEIGHSLGLSHVPRRTSIMYTFTPSKQYPVQLDAGDIVAIRKLYGERGTTPPPTPPLSSSSSSSSLSPSTSPPTSPPLPDLCSLRRIDAILLLEKRMFVARGNAIWSIDPSDGTYADPVSLSDRMNFLPRNRKGTIAAYQAPSGHLVLFVDNLVYMVRYPEFILEPEWPKTLHDLGFPPSARINGAVNTHKGRSFVVYNDMSVAEIDECSKRIVRFTPLETTFPGIPSGVRSILRHLDGNLYFATSTQFYKFNEFTRTVTAAGKFDLRMLNIACPKTELWHQLRDLMSRILRVGQSQTRDSNGPADYNSNESGFQIST